MRRLFAVVILVAGVWAHAPTPAGAQVGERIRTYDVVLVVGANGTLTVRETIDYDFGTTPRHGIFRDIPVRFRYDGRYDRVYPLDVVSVSASPGTPNQYKTETSGRVKRIRVGDPKKTITGVHKYVLVYRVRAALNGFDDHDELFWNAIGAQWDVPIDQARAQVRAPATVSRVACFTGPEGSRLPCVSAAADGPQAAFTQTTMSPRSALTVVAAIPKGAVPEPRPVLDERWTPARAFALTPATGGASGALLAAVIGLLGCLGWRVGRDRRFVGSPVDVAFGTEGPVEHVPLFQRASDPVEFEPPEKIRPGEMGTLVDEVASPLDVTATIVDLAVRGYLRIEEIPKHGWLGKTDWKLTKLKEADGLKQYEEALLVAIFQDGPEVELSDLKTHFSGRLHRVQDALYDDAVAAGWFAGRPDRVRLRWRLIAIAVLAAGVGLTVLLAATTHLGLLPLPLVVAGAGLLVLARRMPRRTARGTGMVRRVHGFRLFIENSEAERARFSERANLFSEYLPYAIVFGATRKWARAFAGLDQQASAAGMGWYVSPHPFSVVGFTDSIGDFAVTTSGTIVASTPSSSGSSGFGGGGFSGGGGGGGGGGSW